MAYLKKEKGCEAVIKMLSDQKGNSLIMNEINVGESYYIIAGARGVSEADYFVETILPNLPIRLISNTFDDIIEVAKLKAAHPMSYADCFAVATAVREKASIVTGDTGFKAVKNLVEIDWL
jgi:ribonuclease VapC